MSKKILAMLMAVAMAFSLLPVTALAGNPSPLSITQPGAEKFATYEFYINENAESPWYTQTVKTGDMLNPPADPTLAGSHFTGWKTADGKEVPFGTVTVKETSIIQCYAKWEENKNPIHVYFMAAIGSNEVMHTGVAQNGAVDIPPDYQDITWKTEKNETFDRTNVTEDMKVYPASASCWLTFDSQGGSAIASHYVRQGESFELSKVGKPTKAGYTFAGWSLTTDGETVGQVIPKGDTKLYALWKPATAKYTVIHWQENANDTGYSYIESETKSGTTEDQTNAAAKSYQGFIATGIEQQTIKGDDSTIVNVFYKRNVYQVKFKLDKPTYTCGKEEHEHTHGFLGIGSCYDKNGNLKCGKEAHTHDKFCGKTSEIVISAKYGAYIGDQWPTIHGSSAWQTSKGGKTSQINIDTMPLNGATFYGPRTGNGSESAHYYVEVLPGESGTVKQGDVTYKLHHTDTSPGTGAKVTKEDQYPLTGFTYKEGTSIGSRYNNAQFYYTRNSYNVVYISNGVEVKKEPYKYEQDIRGAGSYKPDNAPTGYTFGGWYSNPSEATPYNFSGKKMPAQNITVYAKWVPITLTLTIEGVEGVTSGTVNYNQVINRAEVYGQATTILENAGETVLYWVTSTGERVDVNRQMTTNLTIRPVLKGDTYTVTYTSGANDSQKYWYNTIAKVKNYTGDNAGKFLYWTDADENQYHPGDVIQMTANVTLKPNFSVENPGQTKYSVIYHSNFEPDQTCTADSVENYTTFFTKTYTETRLPSQNGYKFTGWNTQSDGNGTSFAAGSSALMDGPDNNHLYAQWQRCTYTLTYDANGGYFGSVENTTTTEGMITAGKHDLLYTPEYTPNHEQTSEGKNVIFLGWSEEKENVLTKANVNNANAIASSIITKVNIPAVKTVYAVWSLDENGNNFPDVFEATVTYNIVGGTWDGTNTTATEVIKVKEFNQETKEWTATKNTLNDIPDINNVKPTDGYTKTGTWDPELDKTTPVTDNKMYTYTLKEAEPPTPPAPVEWDVSRSKIASGLTKNSNGDWTTTVKLTLPTVKQKEAQSGQTIAISKGSYVIDQIGNEFTFVPELTLKVGDKTYNGTESTSDANGTTYTFGSTEYKVTYTAKNGDTPAQFTWNINEDVYAGTEVTLSYKLKLTNPKTGTYGVTDLNGDGKVDGTDTAVDPNKALYTNKSAALYKDKQEIAVFPKPSVFYTVSSGSSGSHSGGSRPSLNTKDHYGYIIGYPVDYYTGQPTTDQTKKPVRPEGKITRAEVATIYFRMLTDESRTKFWSQSSGYSDVKTGDWFNNAVSTLSKAGIIAGYEDGSFRPNGYITRAEFATIAARFFDVTYNGKDLFPDISGHWAKDYINQAANKGFVNGYEDGTFKPDRNITRAEAVTLVNRTLDRHPDKNHFTKDMLVWPDNMDQTKWYYADMQEATNSHTYQMKENSDKTKYENWTKTLPIRNWEALEKAWSNANSSQGNGNVV